jgi:PDZ domain-containing protein
MWLAGGLSVLLLGAAAVTTVPYVALQPGPAINTLGKDDAGGPILVIKGARTYPTDGELDLTTVEVRDHLHLFEALKGWLSSREAVLPREFVYPEDRSEAQNAAENQKEMAESQDAAADAALSELGLARISVDSVTKGGASVGKLRPGDVIVSVDGSKVTGAGTLRALIRRHRIGEQVVLGIERAGQPRDVTITTGRSVEDKTKAAVGIVTKISSRVKVDITLSDVGGPSAGLMFALGIIDKLGPQSLTGGRHVAGTGTIAVDGTVGPIGGIAEKLLGARDVGAAFFLVPALNCAEAKKHRPDGLVLSRVDTLHDALASLAAIRAGRTPRPC